MKCKICDLNSKNLNCIKCLKKILQQSIKISFLEFYGGKCSNCSYNKCIRALEFHHKDENLKSFEITTNMLTINSIPKLRKELDKTIILCSNCHKELHFKKSNNKLISSLSIQYKKDKKLLDKIKNAYSLNIYPVKNKPVKQIDIETNKIINIFPSIRLASMKIFNHKDSKIGDVCRKKNNLKTCGGFKWEFATLAELNNFNDA